ncbi:uncharacterized protein LOC135160164 [Diachasmimorpha longicaudata]|uniref:uncharacterized protein LOC135160164 n=1 Tax=Diachasmimorpha longicaudata TaxID=58733 RepID=UPI0030B8E8A4
MGPPMLKRRANLPKILWYQDDVKVVLRIMLVDVKKYFVDVDFDHVRFSTIHDDKVYYLSLYFFGTVVPEKTVNENTGREIRIQFVKAHKFYNWLRLEDTTERTRQIIPDPDKIVEESFDRISRVRGWEDFETYKTMNKLNIYPDVPSSDSDESDDDRYFLAADC